MVHSGRERVEESQQQQENTTSSSLEGEAHSMVVVSGNSEADSAMSQVTFL